jgi:hypothetical protein
VVKKKRDQISLRYKRGSLNPEAKRALQIGGKHLITFYQDEIARLTARLGAADAEIAIQLAQGWNWRAIAEAAASKTEEINKQLAADAFEKEFWIEELVRYRNWVIALLREKAQLPK